MRNCMTPGGGRRTLRSVATTGMLVLVCCAGLAGCGRPEAELPRGGIGEDLMSALPPAAAKEAGEQVADPVRIRIPAIGVDAGVEPLEVDENGMLPAPATNEGTGWWRDGPEPGERGPAVIAGHVDSFQGPAVFFRLTEIGSGDEIFIDRRDGSTAVFAAARIEQHGKESFPTQAVYGDVPDPQLRLITCGGEFDDTARRYLDNIIVYAFRIR
jgi:sortase (surface protein transpeptidase)